MTVYLGNPQLSIADWIEARKASEKPVWGAGTWHVVISKSHDLPLEYSPDGQYATAEYSETSDDGVVHTVKLTLAPLKCDYSGKGLRCLYSNSLSSDTGIPVYTGERIDFDKALYKSEITFCASRVYWLGSEYKTWQYCVNALYWMND